MEDAGQLQPFKEVPEQLEENGTRPASPIRVAGPSKEAEEMLLRPPPVFMETQEVANGSRPPTPDVVNTEISSMEVDGRTEANEAIQEQEGIDGVTIQEKDLIPFSPAPPTAVEEQPAAEGAAASETPEVVDPSRRSRHDDEGQGRRHPQKPAEGSGGPRGPRVGAASRKRRKRRKS